MDYLKGNSLFFLDIVLRRSRDPGGLTGEQILCSQESGRQFQQESPEAITVLAIDPYLNMSSSRYGLDL